MRSPCRKQGPVLNRQEKCDWGGRQRKADEPAADRRPPPAARKADSADQDRDNEELQIEEMDSPGLLVLFMSSSGGLGPFREVTTVSWNAPGVRLEKTRGAG